MTAKAFRGTHAGTTDQLDGFMLELNATRSKLLYSTYLGGSATDFATAIAIDSTGKAYVTGAASSSDFPTTADAFQTRYAGPSTDTCTFSVSNADTIPCGDAFVSKIDPSQSGKASLVWSSFLGGSSNDDALARGSEKKRAAPTPDCG